MKNYRNNKKIDINNMSTFQIGCYFFNFFCRSFLYASISLVGLFLLVCAIYFADLMLNVRSGNYSIPLFGSYVIVSESMVPTINVNDCVIVKRTDQDNFKVGDVITFNSNNDTYKDLTITHRIVGTHLGNRGSILYRTKGDNNSSNDPAYVSYDSIYGKVIFKVPRFGYIQKVLTNPVGLIICLSFILVLVLVGCSSKVVYKIRS